MKSKHVAFFLEQAYGHLIPTIGMALELLRRGHRVSYAVTRDFAPLIHRCGARAVTFDPMETRTPLCRSIARQDGSYDARPDNVEFMRLYTDLRKQRTADSAAQLEKLYCGDYPDLVVHDDCFDTAGKSLAVKWGIPKIRHEPCMLSKRRIHRYADDDDQLIMVSVPEFLNEAADCYDDRFVAVGFVAEGRREFSEPWQHADASRSTILVCPTTGQMPQVEFCKLVINAFQALPLNVVLSIPAELDPVSAISPAAFPTLPPNFHINRYSSNLEILESAFLFIGQGGPGSTLEALYSGVPPLLVPVSPTHDDVASRVAALGLGARLHIADLTAERLRELAVALIENNVTLARVREVQISMQRSNGAQTAADLIERHFHSYTKSSAAAQ